MELKSEVAGSVLQ